MREEHRLRNFENRMLRREFGFNGGVVTGEWTAQQMLLGLANQAGKDRYLAGMGDRRSEYRF
jgi:hypothetical protein